MPLLGRCSLAVATTFLIASVAHPGVGMNQLLAHPDGLGYLVALVKPLLEGTANAVFGVRAFDGFTSHSYLYVLGNRAVTLAANVLFNVYIKDLMTMHNAVRTDIFRSLSLRETGFAIEPE